VFLTTILAFNEPHLGISLSVPVGSCVSSYQVVSRLILIWLIYVVVWLIPILLKNKRDKHMSRQYAAEGTALIPDYKKIRRLQFLDPYSAVFHALATGLLLLAFNHSLKH
jgi:hypothetical protein